MFVPTLCHSTWCYRVFVSTRGGWKYRSISPISILFVSYQPRNTLPEWSAMFLWLVKANNII